MTRDSQPINQVEPQAPAPSGRPPESPGEKLSVDEAKRRFVDAMRAVDLLEPLRNHPYVVLGSAATAGAVLGSSGKVVLGLAGLLSAASRLVKPLTGLVAQIVAAKLAAHSVADAQTAAAADADPQPSTPVEPSAAAEVSTGTGN